MVKDTLEYMKFPVNAWGFKIADSLEVVYPSFKENPEYRSMSEIKIEAAAKKFHTSLLNGEIDYSFQKFIFFNLLKLKVQLHKKHASPRFSVLARKRLVGYALFTPEKMSQP